MENVGNEITHIQEMKRSIDELTSILLNTSKSNLLENSTCAKDFKIRFTEQVRILKSLSKDMASFMEESLKDTLIPLKLDEIRDSLIYFLGKNEDELNSSGTEEVRHLDTNSFIELFKLCGYKASKLQISRSIELAKTNKLIYEFVGNPDNNYYIVGLTSEGRLRYEYIYSLTLPYWINHERT